MYFQILFQTRTTFTYVVGLLWKIHLLFWKAILVLWISCWINCFLINSMTRIASAILVRTIVIPLYLLTAYVNNCAGCINSYLWLSQCKIDMESLISDHNRSIASLAITSLLTIGIADE